MVPRKCLVVWISRLILKLISPCIKNDFRTLEKLEKKFILNKLHLEFNEICIKEDLLPNYTNIRTHDVLILEPAPSRLPRLCTTGTVTTAV